MADITFPDLLHLAIFAVYSVPRAGKDSNIDIPLSGDGLYCLSKTLAACLAGAGE